jgi:thymidylate synthase
MSSYDKQLRRIVRKIKRIGLSNEGKPIRAKWDSDGTPAYARSILNERMKFNGECPFITFRKLGYKMPIHEIRWIAQKKSNDVELLRKMNGTDKTVWDQWQQEDGTILKAYGWQLRHKTRKVKLTPELAEMIDSGELEAQFYKDFSDYVELDQIDYVIYQLKTNRYSNQIKTTLWGVSELDEMALPPCAYETHWQTWDEKLHLTLNIRSNDMPLGSPFNAFQYYVLQRMMAQAVGMKHGTLTINIDNAHIYDRHEEQMYEMVERKSYRTPKLWVNPDVKNFYDFTTEDFKLLDYESGDPIKFEDIAV